MRERRAQPRAFRRGAGPHPQPPKAPGCPAGTGGQYSGRGICSPHLCPLAGPSPEAAAGAPAYLARARGCAAAPASAREAREAAAAALCEPAPRRTPRLPTSPGSWIVAGAPQTRRAARRAASAAHPALASPAAPRPGRGLGNHWQAGPRGGKKGRTKMGRAQPPSLARHPPPPARRRDSRRGGRAHLGPGPAVLVSGTGAGAQALEAAAPHRLGPWGAHRFPGAPRTCWIWSLRGPVLRRVEQATRGSTAPAPSPARRAAPWRFGSASSAEAPRRPRPARPGALL